MKTTFVVPALLFLAVSAVPQATRAQNPVSSALRDILPGRQRNTIAAAEAMPADKFDYKPTADQMTFGHLVAHMVEANNLLCSKAAGVSAPQGTEVKETDTKDKLVAALRASFNFCSETLAKMDDSRLGETTEGFGGKQVTRAWFSLVLARSYCTTLRNTIMKQAI